MVFLGFPRGKAYQTPGLCRHTPGFSPGENHPAWKSKVGAWFVRFVTPGVYQVYAGIPQGKSIFPGFPQGKGMPNTRFTFLGISENPDSRPTWNLVGSAAPGFHQGKSRGFARGKAVFLPDWFPPGEKQFLLVNPWLDAMLR